MQLAEPVRKVRKHYADFLGEAYPPTDIQFNNRMLSLHPDTLHKAAEQFLSTRSDVRLSSLVKPLVVRTIYGKLYDDLYETEEEGMEHIYAIPDLVPNQFAEPMDEGRMYIIADICKDIDAYLSEHYGAGWFKQSTNQGFLPESIHNFFLSSTEEGFGWLMRQYKEAVEANPAVNKAMLASLENGNFSYSTFEAAQFSDTHPASPDQPEALGGHSSNNPNEMQQRPVPLAHPEADFANTLQAAHLADEIELPKKQPEKTAPAAQAEAATEPPSEPQNTETAQTGNADEWDTAWLNDDLPPADEESAVPEQSDTPPTAFAADSAEAGQWEDDGMTLPEPPHAVVVETAGQPEAESTAAEPAEPELPETESTVAEPAEPELPETESTVAEPAEPELPESSPIETPIPVTGDETDPAAIAEAAETPAETEAAPPEAVEAQQSEHIAASVATAALAAAATSVATEYPVAPSAPAVADEAAAPAPQAFVPLEARPDETASVYGRLAVYGGSAGEVAALLANNTLACRVSGNLIAFQSSLKHGDGLPDWVALHILAPLFAAALPATLQCSLSTVARADAAQYGKYDIGIIQPAAKLALGHSVWTAEPADGMRFQALAGHYRLCRDDAH